MYQEEEKTIMKNGAYLASGMNRWITPGEVLVCFKISWAFIRKANIVIFLIQIVWNPKSHNYTGSNLQELSLLFKRIQRRDVFLLTLTYPPLTPMAFQHSALNLRILANFICQQTSIQRISAVLIYLFPFSSRFFESRPLHTPLNEGQSLTCVKANHAVPESWIWIQANHAKFIRIQNIRMQVKPHR